MESVSGTTSFPTFRTNIIRRKVSNSIGIWAPKTGPENGPPSCAQKSVPRSVGHFFVHPFRVLKTAPKTDTLFCGGGKRDTQHDAASLRPARRTKSSRAALPEWGFDGDDDGVHCQPLPVGLRGECLDILVPAVRRDDGDTIVEEVSFHMLSRGAVADVDPADTVLEYLPVPDDQLRAAFIP